MELAELPHAAKLKFFQEIELSFGRSALMLSGGATLGLFHVGVVKALYRESLLPPVMSGSSAGSVVSATVGTRATHEVEELLDPESARSEEHTSELQSLMRISYAVLCLKKKKTMHTKDNK